MYYNIVYMNYKNLIDSKDEILLKVLELMEEKRYVKKDYYGEIMKIII